jgi:nitroreductase
MQNTNGSQPENKETDIYQERYLKHQKRKAESLTSIYGKKDFKKYSKKEQDTFFEVLKNRCSQRSFTNEQIDETPILEAIKTAPSSCDRKGILVKVVSERNDKDLLSGLLVGGTGWIYRADKILLLIADMDCYKNPAERSNMPYLDAGVLIQTAYLTCEVMNYGCCFVNPNIREENKEFFNNRFGIKENQIFCGIVAIGKYNFKHKH